MRRSAAIVGILMVYSTVCADEPVAPAQVRSAVERSLKRIEAGANRYPVQRSCFSCHHQLCIPVFAAARERGFVVSNATLFLQIEFTRETFRNRIAQVEKGQGVGGSNTTVAYALMILAAGDHAPDETTAALAKFLVVRQAKDGSWPATTDRPPSEGSPFTNASLALAGLKVYGLADASMSSEQRDRIGEAWKRGRDWLLDHEPKSLEDRVFHLQGLVHADADRKRIDNYRQQLRRLQQKDGSWAQLPDMPRDAYATALALLALHRAGDATTDSVWQRGLAFLLRTQNPDGSWLVTTRSKPVQLFFDNGDPGGKSQFISMTATNWATLALLQALPKAE